MTIQKHPYGYWTNDRIIEESKKYKTPIEFKINAPTAYKKANEKKLIKEMRWLKQTVIKSVDHVQITNTQMMWLFHLYNNINV